MVQENCLNGKKVVVVCGPTASGKSALAIALAKRLGGAVVSADSIAIYKKLDIGTAKPDKDEMRGVKHYLIDHVDPEKEFTVAEYSSAARAIIDELIFSGVLPVICGGTGYYIDSVLYDLSYGNCPKSNEIRQKYADLLQSNGAGYLHDRLKEVDRETSLVLHENDTVRVIRALEIFELTGRKKSETTDEKTARYDFKAYSFDYDRKELYDRINARVDDMFRRGLKQEVVSLLESGLDKNCQSMQAIGYKEIVEGIDAGLSDEEIKELVKRNTRRYAKRQITYFKRYDNMTFLDPKNYSLDDIVSDLKQWMSLK
ncbi:MAG: tRNA (adenosine(37)-N6)-dimethylallyltransferase MiaA [Clostridia bacterium]|nr:tRNA (adenosine(37)-N6)-dimethylallyltransferase MiaA [Clostridia bacterium]